MSGATARAGARGRAATTARAAEPALAPPAEAVALLGEVVSRLPSAEPAVVQFVAASGTGNGAVARAFAAASVARFGRSLLVTAGLGDGTTARAPEPASPRAPERGRGKNAGLVPDASIAGLYHLRLHGGAAEASRIVRDTQSGWSMTMAEFRMIIIECPAPSLCPETLLLAMACNGVVLTVLAGATRRQEVQASARQVQQAGGTLLGCVLHEAPASLGVGRTRPSSPRRWRV